MLLHELCKISKLLPVFTWSNIIDEYYTLRKIIYIVG